MLPRCAWPTPSPRRPRGFASVTRRSRPGPRHTFNFAIVSQHEPISLHVEVGSRAHVIDLARDRHRTGSVYHAGLHIPTAVQTSHPCVFPRPSPRALPDPLHRSHIRYRYSVRGRWVLDPYATLLDGPVKWGESAPDAVPFACVPPAGPASPSRCVLTR